MKMKKACEATALTERAIRLYLKKNLLSPRQIGGIIDFSDEDVQRLKDIALLRQLDFTIEQIASMIHDPAAIPDIVLLRLDSARADGAHEKEVEAALLGLDRNGLDSLRTTAAQIRARRVSPEPDFSRFDEIGEDVRRQERLIALRDLSAMEKRRKRRNRMLAAVCVFAALAAATMLFLAHPRIKGQISVAPVTVMAIGDETATVSIENEWAADVLGRETITVPYQFHRGRFEVGDTLSGCQLAIELTNLDLARMGISPLQPFRARSAEVNDAWMKFILRSLFDSAPGEHATLWVNEIANLRPLISPR